MMRTSKALLFCVALASCEMEPDELVVLGGQVLDADHTPENGAQVAIGRGERTPATAESQLVFEPWKTAETQADGWFFVELRGRDLDSSWEAEGGRADQKLFRLAVGYQSGARVLAILDIQGGDNALPAFVPWLADLTVLNAADGVLLSWSPFPQPEAPFSMPAEYAWLARSNGKLLWFARTAATQTTAPAYLFEDFADTELSALATLPGSRLWYPMNGRSALLNFRFFYEAVPRAAEGIPSVPASRGASCVVSQQPYDACPLTDGELADFQFPAETREIAFDLEDPRSFSRIVFRNLRIGGRQTTLLIEGSNDGEIWIRLAIREVDLDAVPWSLPDAGLFLDLPLAQNEPVSQVRVRSEQPLDAATEVSVF